MLLQAIQLEAKQQESDFKALSSTAQSISQSCSDAEAKDMIATLRKIRDRLLRANKDAAEREGRVAQFVPQVEALEKGVGDLTAWLDGGEQLLASHRIDGDILEVEARLAKHMVISEICWRIVD